MSEVLRSVTEFFEKGGMHVMLPLAALAALIGEIVLERAATFGISPGDWLVPALRRKRQEERRLFLEAWRAYLHTPSGREGQALLARSGAAPPPVARFLERVLPDVLRDVLSDLGDLRPPAARAQMPAGTDTDTKDDVRIDAALRQGRAELRGRLEGLPHFGFAALLLGLLGAVGGLSRSLDAAAVSGGGLEALSSRFPQALLGSQAALMVCLLAAAAGIVLRGRAASLERELSRTHLQIRGAVLGHGRERETVTT